MLGRKTDLRHYGGPSVFFRVLIRTPRLMYPECLRQGFWSLVQGAASGLLGGPGQTQPQTHLPMAAWTLPLSTGSVAPCLLPLGGAAWSDSSGPSVKSTNTSAPQVGSRSLVQPFFTHPNSVSSEQECRFLETKTSYLSSMSRGVQNSPGLNRWTVLCSRTGNPSP